MNPKESGDPDPILRGTDLDPFERKQAEEQLDQVEKAEAGLSIPSINDILNNASRADRLDSSVLFGTVGGGIGTLPGLAILALGGIPWISIPLTGIGLIIGVSASILYWRGSDYNTKELEIGFLRKQYNDQLSEIDRLQSASALPEVLAQAWEDLTKTQARLNELRRAPISAKGLAGRQTARQIPADDAIEGDYEEVDPQQEKETNA